LKAGASLAAGVTLEDDFQLVFSRPKADRVRVAVRKARSRTRTATASLGIEASLEGLDKLLNGVVASVAGKEIAFVDGVFAKASVDSLSAEERKLLSELIDRLELGTIEDGIAKLRDAWESWKERLNQAIEKAARGKVEAGFRYEYLRVDNQTALLQFVCADADAAALHGALVLGRVSEVVGKLRQGQVAAELETYLNQRTLEVRQAWGFTLGFAGWQVGGKDAKQLQIVEQRNFEDALRVACLGVRSYERRIGANRASWSVDFKADCERFATPPTLRDLYYGLHYLYVHDARKMKPNDLRLAIDEAIAWDVVDEADEEAIVDSLKGFRGKKVETRLELKLDDETLRAVAAAPGFGDPAAFATALARTMAWLPGDQFKARQVAERRQQIYRPLWQALLTSPTLTPKDAAFLARQHLARDPVAKTMANWESGGGFASYFQYSFPWYVEVDRDGTVGLGTATAWIKGVGAVSRLREGIANGWSYEAFRGIFNDLQGLWSQFHRVRASGAYLLALARTTALGWSRIERTFTVRNGEDAVVFTTRRGPAGE